MLYIAHRGHSNDKNKKNENSITAIRNAIHLKFDGIEIDVQLCKSGEIVLFHDTYIDTTFIEDAPLTFLKDTYGVCSLEDVYREVPEIQTTGILIIDIKGVDPLLVEKLESFYENKDTSNVYFCSFNRQILSHMNPELNKGTTFEAIFTKEEYATITRGFQCVVVHWTCLNEVLMQHCALHNITVLVYTHKTRIQYTHIMKYKPTALITDASVLDCVRHSII